MDKIFMLIVKQSINQ